MERWTRERTPRETQEPRPRDGWIPDVLSLLILHPSLSLLHLFLIHFVHSSLRSLVPVFADKRWIDREDRTSERNVVRVNMRRGIESISTTSLKQPERENTHHEERCFQANTLVGSLLLVTHSFSLLVRLCVPLALSLLHFISQSIVYSTWFFSPNLLVHSLSLPSIGYSFISITHLVSLFPSSLRSSLSHFVRAFSWMEGRPGSKANDRPEGKTREGKNQDRDRDAERSVEES